MKTRNESAKCGSCPFFLKGARDESHGLCLRFPPRRDDGHYLVIIDADLVCGEHPEFFLE